MSHLTFKPILIREHVIVYRKKQLLCRSDTTPVIGRTNLLSLSAMVPYLPITTKRLEHRTVSATCYLPQAAPSHNIHPLQKLFFSPHPRSARCSIRHIPFRRDLFLNRAKSLLTTCYVGKNEVVLRSNARHNVLPL